MSLRIAVAAPFAQNGTRTLRENEFVVALSLDRDWFSPDQSQRLIDIATRESLLDRDGDELELAFDPTDVTVPDEFVPDTDLLRERSAFERVLDALVADGVEKQIAVGSINTLQRELGVTIETAAVVYARREGIAIDEIAPIARAALGEED